MAVPSWVDKVYSHMERLAPLFFDSRVIVPNDEAKRVKAGPLLTYLVRNMDVKRNSSDLSEAEKKAHRKAKFYMISGHDTTSSIVLGAINVFETQFPSYASTAIFEMHKGRKNQRVQNTEDHYVRVSLISSGDRTLTRIIDTFASFYCILLTYYFVLFIH